MHPFGNTALQLDYAANWPELELRIMNSHVFFSKSFPHFLLMSFTDDITNVLRLLIDLLRVFY